jgi:hypothetical protein
MTGFRLVGRGAEEGAVAVEFALVGLGLFLLIFGIVEFGRALWTYNTMLLAVEEGGRYAMIYTNYANYHSGAPPLSCPGPSSLADCVKARVEGVLSDYAAPSGITVSDPTISAGNMTISATYNFDFILPNLLPYGPIALTSQVAVPLI